MTRSTMICLLLLAACGENRTIPTRESYVAPTVAPLECVPNLDGRIDATELKAAIGVPVHYLASPPGTARCSSIMRVIERWQSTGLWL